MNTQKLQNDKLNLIQWITQIQDHTLIEKIKSLMSTSNDNLQGILSITGTPIPSEFMLMAPYIATIIAVTGFVGRVRAPAADGIPYNRGGSN